MGVLFSGNELINIAIGIEKNGVAFYEALARSARGETARNMYRHLADEERKHIAVFQNLLASLADFPLPETYTEEYDLYLRALVGSAVFPDDKVAREIAARASSTAEALQVALGAEKDSLLFYSELRDLVRRSSREVVNRIIEEERSHLKRLSDFKNNLSATEV